MSDHKSRRLLRLLGLVAAIAAIAVAVFQPGRAEAACTSWPTNTNVAPGGSYVDTINVSGLAYGTYFITTSATGNAPLVNLAVSATPGYSNGSFPGPATTMYLSFVMHSAALPQRTSTITTTIANALGQVVCTSSFVVTVPGDACPLDATWLGAPIDATYDTANCYVHDVPVGDGAPFIWSNKYYVTRGPNNACEVGWFDGANCYLGQPPVGKSGFHWGTAFYYTP